MLSTLIADFLLKQIPKKTMFSHQEQMVPFSEVCYGCTFLFFFSNLL